MQRSYHPPSPLITFCLAIAFPPTFAKKFLTVSIAPTPKQAPFNPLTMSPNCSDFSSQSLIVSFNSLIFFLVFSGESSIALFSIPTLKLKFASVPALLILGITETLAEFLRFILLRQISYPSFPISLHSFKLTFKLLDPPLKPPELILLASKIAKLSSKSFK